MKINYISSSRIPSAEANSVHVIKMCQAMSANGHDVELVGWRGQATDDIFTQYGVSGGFKITTVDVLDIRFVGQLLYILQQLVRLWPDRRNLLVYTRNIFCLVLFPFFGFKLVYEAHAYNATGIKGFFVRNAIKRPAVLRVVVITNALKHAYSTLFSSEGIASKFLVAADAADFAAEETRGNTEQQKHLRPAVGYVGSLYPGKGVELIVEIARILPDVDFHIVGGSSAEIDQWRDTTTSNIIFHGRVAHSQVADHIEGFDIALAPNQRRKDSDEAINDLGPWASPLKIFEYAAAGCPVIISDFPVLREIFVADTEAIYVDPDHPEEWAKVIRRLLDDSALRNELADNARQRVLKEYTWTNRAEKVLQDL